MFAAFPLYKALSHHNRFPVNCELSLIEQFVEGNLWKLSFVDVSVRRVDNKTTLPHCWRPRDEGSLALLSALTSLLLGLSLRAFQGEIIHFSVYLLGMILNVMLCVKQTGKPAFETNPPATSALVHDVFFSFIPGGERTFLSQEELCSRLQCPTCWAASFQDKACS